MAQSDPSRLGSEPFNVLVDRRVRIPTDDPAVSLAVDLYRPVTADPVPAVVSTTPYRRDLVGESFARLHRTFAAHGYASLLVDMRGTGDSDGIYREFDPIEGRDAALVIAWTSGQPWCDGNVGMWGHSYGALTTLRAASLAPPQLRAIISLQGPSDPERHTVHPDGSRGDFHAFAFRGAIMLGQQLLPPLLDREDPDQQRRWHMRLREAEPIALDFAAHGPGHPEWRTRAVDVASINTPALCIGGWADMHCQSIVDTYESLSGPKRLLMGPWPHVLPHVAPMDSIDFPAIALQWWDHWLRGIDSGAMDHPPVTLYLPGDEPRWRAFDSWPPTPAAVSLETDATGTLVWSASHHRPRAPIGEYHLREYQSDPTAGALSGLWGTLLSGLVPKQDQHDDDLRGLCFTSEPLAADLMVLGPPRVTVVLSGLDGHATHLVMRLADVDPRGRSTLITAGVMTPEDHSPMPEIRTALRPVAHRAEAGHRLRVVVSDSDFPRLTPLADPVSFSVLKVHLTIPVLAPDSGHRVHMATPTAANEPNPGQPPEVVISRDLINDGVSLKVSHRVGPASTAEGHDLEILREILASVPHANPAAATVVSDYEATARLRTGERIDVSATVRATRHSVWLHGEAQVDGRSVYSQTWDCPL